MPYGLSERDQAYLAFYRQHANKRGEINLTTLPRSVTTYAGSNKATDTAMLRAFTLPHPTNPSIRILRG
jgi:hypothetical protein